MSKETIKSILSLEKKVAVGEKTLTIKKLPLGEYAKILFALKKMPGSILSDLQGLDTEKEDEFVGVLFGVIGEAWGQVLDIIAIGSGLDREVIENDPNIGLDGGIALFMAIYEVNNLKAVFKTVKNVMSQAK